MGKTMKKGALTIALVIVAVLILPAAFLQVISMQSLPIATWLVGLVNTIDAIRRFE